jgi:hypothetical protein
LHRLVDAHGKASFSTRKPDLVAYHPETTTDTPFGITFLADWKGAREAEDAGGFSKAEIGQLLGFCEDLLEMQLGRHSLTAFLSDGRIIQFFRVTRKDGLYSACSTIAYELESETKAAGTAQGALLLLKLLRCSAAELDAPFRLIIVDGKLVELNEWLGSGRSAVVYQAKFNGLDVAAKLFRDKEDLEREKQALEKVSAHPQLHGLVPRLEGSTEDVLLLSPVGEPFATTLMSMVKAGRKLPQLEDMQQLLEIVRLTGQVLKMVHRDLSLANFFRRKSDGQVSLIPLTLFFILSFCSCFSTTGALRWT